VHVSRQCVRGIGVSAVQAPVRVQRKETRATAPAALTKERMAYVPSPDRTMSLSARKDEVDARARMARSALAPDEVRAAATRGRKRLPLRRKRLCANRRGSVYSDVIERARGLRARGVRRPASPDKIRRRGGERWRSHHVTMFNMAGYCRACGGGKRVS